jgi:hypothetical protein
MMAASYSGAWKRATLPVSQVPLKPGIDREHSHPSDAPDPSYVVSYVDGTGAPTLPDEWTGGQYVQDPVPSEFSDQTPVSHEVGTGFLPGVDVDEAQRIGGWARSQDLGAMDARDYERPAYQEDGSTHGEIISRDLAGASPADLKYDEKGVGVGIDPDARSNRRITRRPTGPAQFDSRWFDPSMRPRYLHVAQGSHVRQQVPGRQANTPDSGSGVILRPDNWAAPVVRRSAAGWDQPFATDAQTPTAPGDFGLGSWGL